MIIDEYFIIYIYIIFSIYWILEIKILGSREGYNLIFEFKNWVRLVGDVVIFVRFVWFLYSMI